MTDAPEDSRHWDSHIYIFGPLVNISVVVRFCQHVAHVCCFFGFPVGNGLVELAATIKHVGKVLTLLHIPLAEVAVEASAPVEHSVKILHVGNIPFGKVVIEAFFLCEKTRHVRHTASVPGGNGAVYFESTLGFLIGFSVTNFTPCSANVFLALGAPWHKTQHMVAEFFGKTVHHCLLGSLL